MDSKVNDIWKEGRSNDLSESKVFNCTQVDKKDCIEWIFKIKSGHIEQKTDSQKSINNNPKIWPGTYISNALYLIIFV